MVAIFEKDTVGFSSFFSRELAVEELLNICNKYGLRRKLNTKSKEKFGFINGVDNVNWPPYRDSKS